MTSLMWKQDFQLVNEPCDKCVKDTTYANLKLCERRCAECGAVMDL